MKALVTGGAGFIGSNIVRLLLANGHEPVVLDDLSSGYMQNVSSLDGVAVTRGDVCDGETMSEAARGAGVIFHLAASVGNQRSIDDPLGDARTNVLGTITVLEAARRQRVPKVVFSSSAGIFGELRELPIREDHPTEPDSPYGASKLAAEKLCMAYTRLYDMDVVALRYFNVYGPYQRYDAYGNVIPIFAHQILHGDPITILGDGGQTRDFVNVADVAQANYAAGMKTGLSGVFNIASATRVTINWLARTMLDLTGIDVPIVHGPPRKGDVRDSIADIGAATTAFGYSPGVRLEEGLAHYLEWLRADLGMP